MTAAGAAAGEVGGWSPGNGMELWELSVPNRVLFPRFRILLLYSLPGNVPSAA